MPEETQGADPVYLFSGEFYESVVDLRIPGRGVDFVWARKYRSKVGPSTRQGNGWDCSYYVFLESGGRDLVVHDGNSRGDVYGRQADGTWGKKEFFRVIVKNVDNSYTLTFPDQGTWRFNPFDGTSSAGRLARSADRNGNSMAFHYDAQGRLDRVTDTLNRDILIGYNGQGFVANVTDFVGRVVRYQYYDGSEPGGSFGDLKSVTSPAVTNTPNANDFPNGKRRLTPIRPGLPTSGLITIC